MRRMGMAGLIAVAAGALWVGATAAQQEMQTRPGPGTGVMDVRVINHPSVLSAQGGDWHVTIGNVPDVRVANIPTVTMAGMPFLRVGGSYTITWADGGTEQITVSETGPAGWVRVQGARTRWVNVAGARAVEQGR